ncbi:winged helix-turn-helix transcriptional regulator [Methanosarcina sp. UBA411]|uniref:winged helix-turn-helix transcriptional regulator n=1 Tax=Methanosarcina sp. UBA411 TaxID=1915589 RepID=UPI0025F336D3|nr:winged helix-turn-helix transcriptional regulator [Methanosarcina sp. UBA411]
MEHRAIHLMFTSIKLEKKLIFCLLFFLLTTTAEATEYIVSPAPSDQVGASINGEKVVKLEDTVIPYWQFLLWLAAMQIVSIIDILLYLAKLILVILGFRIVDKGNVFDNPNRSSIYTYIKTKPGACIGEIVEKTGLGRGRVRHHITILEAQNKIEVYEDGGKIRYFENNSTYEEERKIISALQNVINQRIISEIQNGKCNTNSALAHEIGVSRATISWNMRTLKEVELINEERKGKNIIYRINPSYENLIEKYG